VYSNSNGCIDVFGMVGDEENDTYEAEGDIIFVVNESG